MSALQRLSSRIRRTPAGGAGGGGGTGAAESIHERGAEIGRRIGVVLMHGGWKVRILGAWRVPMDGPVIFAVNHSSLLDGPMIMGVAPRPIHFLIKQEAFVGPLDPFLRAIGQLPVDRASTDRTAITGALRVLQAGGALGVFPEGTRGDGDFAQLRGGLAWFALRSGAPIVPVACLGTGAEESGGRSVPRFRAKVDVVFGEPFPAVETAAGSAPPRGRRAVDQASEHIRTRLAEHLVEARRLTGRR
ncbi:lysophospholipid acyltransferase family protein [Allostreptomyces psammosilenae]|uniref:1-acyl-sn-glycerol-3-phosphate acyltransferase n=1 Tax=Allostreptomyces psammosilenae TaxID=1892865 RepID=A0A852ZYP1_9ACTN|nr:lysophospholipid acyltransferase family protein [Allostreptomyces psammosilenae]NYI03402.1 1-acyl-sn-glycerol-3-phosphate acyltransferase [Allostreptomyces psammosilenae]